MPPIAPSLRLAAWASVAQATAIQQMLALTSKPGVLSFALGLPDVSLFPSEAFAQTVAQLLVEDPQALQYGPPSQALRQSIVELMHLRGVACCQEQVFLTTGAQQAMNLLARVLLDTHGAVILEDKVYSGILQAIEPCLPTIYTVPTDRLTGIDVDAVEQLLQSGLRPAFLYTMSDGHNPLGLSLSQEKRQRLVELARTYQLPIIEDDAYGMLCYESEALRPMRALEEEWVFYVGSFSKILAPALRIGWILVPEGLVSQLSIAKEASDINTATFTQRAAAQYLATHCLTDHMMMLRQAYKERRDAMLDMIQKHFPTATRCSHPRHGMFIWLELGSGIDTGELLKVAMEKEHIAFLPGEAFSIGQTRNATHCMRLNFSHCSVEAIEDGMQRLACCIHGMLSR